MSGPLVLVVMGVSGSGKTTVGSMLARQLRWPFQEGDELHPRANIDKMKAGRPLTDTDRGPWLELIADWVGQRLELLPKPLTCIALVVRGSKLHGVWYGSHIEAWNAAADLSATLEIIRVQHGFRRVLSMPSMIYHDLWTAAKAMYKTEPAIANGGEVVIYAPHLTEISYTHGRLIDDVGYHVLEYFTKQQELFATIPGVIKAHSTHVKGWGAYDAFSNVESPRIDVTLATGIPKERCRRVNLGYLNPRDINPAEWDHREDEGILVVRNAGEMLYRADDVVLPARSADHLVAENSLRSHIPETEILPDLT